MSYLQSRRIKNIQIHKIKETKPKGEEEYALDESLQSRELSSTDLFGCNSFPTPRGIGIYLSAIHLFEHLFLCMLESHKRMSYLYLNPCTYKPCQSRVITEGEDLRHRAVNDQDD